MIIRSSIYRAKASLLLFASCLTLTGCMTMPQGIFPMQNMSRVPAPGTGTYTVPGNYYNNSSAATPGVTQTSGNPGGTSGGMLPVNGALPTTNLTASNSGFGQAQFTSSEFTGTSSGSAVNPVQPASYSESGPAPTNMGVDAFSDGRLNNEANGDDLNWR